MCLGESNLVSAESKPHSKHLQWFSLYFFRKRRSDEIDMFRRDTPSGFAVARTIDEQSEPI